MKHIIQELLFSDLLRLGADPAAPMAKEFEIEARFMEVRWEDFALHWETKDLGPQGSGRIHDSWISINPRKDAQRFNTATTQLDKIRNNLPALRAFLINGFFGHGHVNFWCSCEAFLYFGYEYLAGKYDSHFGDTKETRPPVKKNPNERGIVCKHLLGIVEQLPQFYEPILHELQAELQTQNQLGTPVGAPQQGKQFKKMLKNENPWVKISINMDNIDHEDWIRNVLAYDPQLGQPKANFTEA